MGQLFLFIVVALTVAAIVFGVTVMVGGGDPGLTPVEPDGRALPLPGDRPLGEEDVVSARFDTAVRGYRMAQVDQALQRAAYDIGYKGELIGVLEAEVVALREGRTADADVLRRAREAAVQPTVAEPVQAVPSAERAADELDVPGDPIADPPADAVPADAVPVDAVTVDAVSVDATPPPHDDTTVRDATEPAGTSDDGVPAERR
jgi:DivIVA domain-containing protein